MKIKIFCRLEAEVGGKRVDCWNELDVTNRRKVRDAPFQRLAFCTSTHIEEKANVMSTSGLTQTQFEKVFFVADHDARPFARVQAAQ